MKIKVGINGFGRIGRLVLRAGFDDENFEFVQVNDPGGDANTMAHLLNFDSVHGTWQHRASGSGENILINNQQIRYSQKYKTEDIDWSDCDLVIEASGQLKSKKLLQGYLDQGVKRVVVSCPIKQDNILNVVMGVNDHLFDSEKDLIVTAASCTTNCLAPAVKVIHEKLGIKHGSMTTIHSVTNTQTILDAPHKDLRRARACGASLIPTTTGSAAAITSIFPELEGKLNGHAVRIPLANASLTDCVFEVEKSTSVEEVNQLLQQASQEELKGILGFEMQPLVSIDYTTDPRSSIVDGLSTMVINGTQVKLYLWYDNEWGYTNRTLDLAKLVSGI